METTEQYSHTPLDVNERQIRLLHLLPGKASDPIKVSLEIVRLNGLGDPFYEALSYTWGSSGNAVTIRVNNSLKSITTTRNLAEALHHLRQEDRTRIIWADALCIDQNDGEEKGHQVAMMTEIYGYATKVLVWLGPEADNSDTAFRWVHHVNEHLLVTANMRLIARTEDSSWTDREIPLPITEAETAALAKLLARPWFTRLWVWQEVIQGQERSTLLCGKSSMTALVLINAVRAILMKAYKLSDSVQDLGNAIGRWRRLLLEQCKFSENEFFPYDILRCCDRLRACDCSNPLDRIYAAFGLCGSSLAKTTFVADYAKSIQDTYEDFALWYLRGAGNLDILRFVGNPNKLQNLPSWVPDWTTRAKSDFNYGNAAGGSQKWYQRPSEGRLVVAGKVVAHINDRRLIETTALGRRDREESLRALVAVIDALIRLQVVIPTQENLSMYCNVFWAGSFSEVKNSPGWPSRKTCEALLEQIFGLSDTHDVEPDTSTLLHAAYESLSTLNGKCIFTSTEGGCGLAPRDTRTGDVVAVVLGTEMAMTLRPLDNDTYHMVGPTYIHGFMNREALLGPLPAEYEACEMYHPDGTVYPGHRHLPSGTVAVDDPRIGSLPPDWQRMSHDDEEYYHKFKQDGTGYGANNIAWDPRLDVVVLEAAGHQFEMFTLI